jgi:tripartite ATP-independent transporter DctM subunit
MTTLQLGLSYGGATIVALFSGIPIAFALGAVATLFMLLFMPAASLDTITQNVYEELASITLLTIPLFILKGAAIGKSRAGKDLYDALHTWLSRVPGGLGVAVTLACGLFAAMAGSSPATCSAIGSSGIPEMRRRGYSPGFAAGLVAAGGTLGILLPPSIVLILYAVASEQSLGRLFLAGLGPGLLLMTLFAGYAMLRWRREYHAAAVVAASGGPVGEILRDEQFTMAERMAALPRVLPFVVLLTGVMVALYGGIATPSETAGLGAVLALVLIVLVYGAWRITDLKPIFAGTVGEAGMLLMIIGMSLLYAYVMSYLHISQGAAGWIVSLHPSKWLLLISILLMVVVLGFFLPPVSIILMTAPIILPPLKAAGFDLVWFGIVMAVVMEMGLIHPPVGLNIFVINRIAPDIGLAPIIWGTLPFVMLMALGVVILSVVPQIAMWLPDLVYGA